MSFDIGKLLQSFKRFPFAWLGLLGFVFGMLVSGGAIEVREYQAGEIRGAFTLLSSVGLILFETVRILDKDVKELRKKVEALEKTGYEDGL